MRGLLWRNVSVWKPAPEAFEALLANPLNLLQRQGVDHLSKRLAVFLGPLAADDAIVFSVHVDRGRIPGVPNSSEIISQTSSSMKCMGAQASGRQTRGEYRCLLCDHVLEVFDGSAEVVIRLTVQPEKTR